MKQKLRWLFTLAITLGAVAWLSLSAFADRSAKQKKAVKKPAPATVSSGSTDEKPETVTRKSSASKSGVAGERATPAGERKNVRANASARLKSNRGANMTKRGKGQDNPAEKDGKTVVLPMEYFGVSDSVDPNNIVKLLVGDNPLPVNSLRFDAGIVLLTSNCFGKGPSTLF